MFVVVEHGRRLQLSPACSVREIYLLPVMVVILVTIREEGGRKGCLYPGVDLINAWLKHHGDIVATMGGITSTCADLLTINKEDREWVDMYVLGTFLSGSTV